MGPSNHLPISSKVTATWTPNGIQVSVLGNTLGSIGHPVILSLPTLESSSTLIDITNGPLSEETINKITPHLRAIIQSLITTQTQTAGVNAPSRTTASNANPPRLAPITNEKNKKQILKTLLNLHAEKLRATEGSPTASPRSVVSNESIGSDPKGSTAASAADTDVSSGQELSMAPPDNQTQNDFTDILTEMIKQNNTTAIQAFFESEAATSFFATLTDDTLKQITTQLVKKNPEDSTNLSLLLDAIKNHNPPLLVPFLEAFSDAAILQPTNSKPPPIEPLPILTPALEAIFKQALNALVDHSEETALDLIKDTPIGKIIMGITITPGTPMNLQLKELDMRMNYQDHIQKLENEIKKTKARLEALNKQTAGHKPTHLDSTDKEQRTLPKAGMTREDRDWHDNEDDIKELESTIITLETKKKALEKIKEEEQKSQTSIAAKCKALAKALEVEKQLLRMLNAINKTYNTSDSQAKEKEKSTVTSPIQAIPNLLAHPYGLMLYKQVTQGWQHDVKRTLKRINDQRSTTEQSPSTKVTVQDTEQAPNTKDALQALLDTKHTEVLTHLPLVWVDHDSSHSKPLIQIETIKEMIAEQQTAILNNPMVGACLVTDTESQFHEFIYDISKKDPNNLAKVFEQLNNTLENHEPGNSSAIPSAHKNSEALPELRNKMARHLLTYCSLHKDAFKSWPIDAVRQAYALLAPTIGKSTKPEGLTPPLTTVDTVTVDSQMRQPIKKVDDKSLKKLGIDEFDQAIILSTTETKSGFLELHQRLEADCPGSHCIHVPENLRKPSNSTDASADTEQSQPSTFVRSGKTTTTTAKFELIKDSATTIIDQLEPQVKEKHITTTPTDKSTMEEKNNALMGTGFCWKATDEGYRLHFQAHICTGMDDSSFKYFNERQWLKQMHNAAENVNKSITINGIPCTITPPLSNRAPTILYWVFKSGQFKTWG